MAAMTSPVRLIDVRDVPLSIDEAVAAVADSRAGGICVFIGTVRDHDSGATVTRLDYSSHPTAIARLTEVAERVAGTDDDVVAVAAVHRVGELAVGEVAVVVAVSAGHRPAAFATCRLLIDTLKAEVPLWKQQQYGSGDTAWL